MASQHAAELLADGMRPELLQELMSFTPATRMASSDPGTPGSRFEMLQRDPRIRKAFFEKASFEGGFGNIIEQMARGPDTVPGRVLADIKSPVTYDPSVVDVSRQ